MAQQISLIKPISFLPGKPLLPSLKTKVSDMFGPSIKLQNKSSIIESEKEKEGFNEKWQNTVEKYENKR